MFRLYEALFRKEFYCRVLFIFIFRFCFVMYYDMRLFVFCSVLPVCVYVQGVLAYFVLTI
jgi:hypothetical protein